MAVASGKRSKARGALTGSSPARVTRTPRQTRAQETVDAILAATKGLLVREGVEAVTTNAIARLAGVSIGSLYQYFASREAILAELSRRHVMSVLELVFAEVDALRAPSIQVGARRLIRLMIEIHRKDPEFHRALERSHPSLGARAHLARLEAQVMSTARAYLEQHRDELVVTNLDRAAFVVVSTIEAVTHNAVLQRADLLEDDALIEDLSGMVLGYLTGSAG